MGYTTPELFFIVLYLHDFFMKPNKHTKNELNKLVYLLYYLIEDFLRARRT